MTVTAQDFANLSPADKARVAQDLETAKREQAEAAARAANVEAAERRQENRRTDLKRQAARLREWCGELGQLESKFAKEVEQNRDAPEGETGVQEMTRVDKLRQAQSDLEIVRRGVSPETGWASLEAFVEHHGGRAPAVGPRLSLARSRQLLDEIEAELAEIEGELKR